LNGYSKTIALVHKAYKLVLEGINESLDRINIHIDKYVPESTFVKDKSVEKVISNLKKIQYCHEEDGFFNVQNPLNVILISSLYELPLI